MLRTRRLLATVALATGLAATTPGFAAQSSPAAGAGANADSAALHRLFEDYFERQLQLNPLLATFIGDHRYDDKLTNNISPEHIAIALEVDRKALEDAQKLAARSAVGRRPAERRDLHVRPACFDRRREVPGRARADQPVPEPADADAGAGLRLERAAVRDRCGLRPLPGAHARLHRVVGPGDREHAQGSRAEPDVSARADGEGAAAAAGRSLSPIRKRACSTRRSRIFRTPSPPADRTRLQAAYRDAITKEINPAYQRLHDFIRDEYLKGARTQVGWSTRAERR